MCRHDCRQIMCLSRGRKAERLAIPLDKSRQIQSDCRSDDDEDGLYPYSVIVE